MSTHNPTYTWCCAEVQKHFTFLEKAISPIQLDELEGRSSSVSLFFCKFVPFVESPSTSLLSKPHDAYRDALSTADSLARRAARFLCIKSRGTRLR